MRGNNQEKSSALASSARKPQDAGTARVLKQLILTADDFGRSPEINAAIERAHRAGFLTQASLMVNEPAVDDAVWIAQRNPTLCVGLHLTVCAGRAAQASALTDPAGRFRWPPTPAGLRYFFLPSLTPILRDEIRAQFERFLALGFPPSYWDGHKHFHLHPTILRLSLPIATEQGFHWMRLLREPGPAAFLPAIFQALSRSALPRLQRQGIQFADHVFGLRTTGRMETPTIERLLRELPEGTSELYFHPGAEPGEMDLEKLVKVVRESEIILTTSSDVRSVAKDPC